MTHLNISWTRLEELPAERDGGDPLGLRAAAERQARVLSPAFAQVANRTRAFGLLCLGLQLGRLYDAPDAFLRLERLWVLAHVQQTQGPSSYAGSRIARQELKSPPYSLVRPLLAHDLAQGLWGSFGRSSRLLGLISASRGRGPSGAQLRPPGLALAKRTREAVAPDLTLGDLASLIGQPALSDDDLAQMDGDGTPTAPEIAGVSLALRRFDAPRGRPYAHLHAVFDAAAGVLDLESLRGRLPLLAPDQQDAAARAFAIDRLIRDIEFPYRRWLAGQDVSLGASWVAAGHQGLGGETDVIRLCRLAAAAGMDGVHEHQRRLAAERGSPVLERDVTAMPEKIPDFGLTAPEALFREGVVP